MRIRRNGANLLTRKMLEAFGIDDKIIEQIIDNHGQTVEGLKSEIEGYKNQLAESEELAKQLENDLKKAQADTNGNENYKELYESERAAFGEYKSKVEADRTKAKKETLYRELLRINGIDPKRHDAIIRVTDLEGLELDDNGSLINANALSDSIKSDWSDFVVSTTTAGAKPDTPPTSTNKRSKAEIMGIKDATERQQAIAENIELFKS